jgi:hypothetical protein
MLTTEVWLAWPDAVNPPALQVATVALNEANGEFGLADCEHDPLTER